MTICFAPDGLTKDITIFKLNLTNTIYYNTSNSNITLYNFVQDSRWPFRHANSVTHFFNLTSDVRTIEKFRAHAGWFCVCLAFSVSLRRYQSGIATALLWIWKSVSFVYFQGCSNTRWIGKLKQMYVNLYFITIFLLFTSPKYVPPRSTISNYRV